MDIVYYPDMLVSTNAKLKMMLLFWRRIRTIAPFAEKVRINSYLESIAISQVVDPILESYKRVLELAKTKVLDFVVMEDVDRQRASDKMLNLLTEWNKDTSYFNSLRMRSYGLSVRSGMGPYSLFDSKFDRDLLDLLIQENLLVRHDRQLWGLPQVGKSYLSIVASEIKDRLNTRIATDDEYCVAAKSAIHLKRIESPGQYVDGYQIASITIPQIFIPPEKIEDLTWRQVMKIRQELMPLNDQYYGEIESNQKSISHLFRDGREQEALDELNTFCEKCANSFKLFSGEVSKILGLLDLLRTDGLVADVALPLAVLVNPEFNRQFAVVQLAVSSTKYFLPKPPRKGFEYLIKLDRKLRAERFKNAITRLAPKCVYTHFR